MMSFKVATIQAELAVACRRGDQELVGDCLVRGADVNVELNHVSMATPLGWAVAGGHKEVVEQLIQAGASPWAKVHRDYGCAWLTAASLSHLGVLTIMASMCLEKSELRVSVGNSCPSSLLILSTRNSDLKYNNELLKAAQTLMPWFDLSKAHGLEISPLIHASSVGSVELVSLLLDHGAKAGAAGPNGVTPLMMSSRYNRGVCELLLSKGANVLAVDARRRTALDWAKNRKSKNLVSVLEHAELAALVPPGEDLKRCRPKAL